jgi:hypothetical protein
MDRTGQDSVPELILTFVANKPSKKQVWKHVATTSSWSEDRCVSCHYCYMSSRTQISVRAICQWHSSGLFLRALWQKKGYVVKSTNVLNEVNEDRLTSCRLWPIRSPDLNPCDLYDFYLWWNLKSKVYSHNSCTFDELYTAFVKHLHLSRSVNSN